MISVEKFRMNSVNLIRKYEDSDGFLLVNNEIDVIIYKYIKEYLKILNENIKESIRVLDEIILFHILKVKQKEVIYNYEVIDINRLIAIKHCVNVIRSSRID